MMFKNVPHQTLLESCSLRWPSIQQFLEAQTDGLLCTLVSLQPTKQPALCLLYQASREEGRYECILAKDC
jgi:hypothetical protein